MMNGISLLIGVVLIWMAHYLAFRARQSQGRGRLNEFLVRWGVGGSYLENLKSGCLTVVFKIVGGVCAIIGLGLILKGCGVLDESCANSGERHELSASDAV